MPVIKQATHNPSEPDNTQLEQELLEIWRRAANTRKATSPRRVGSILRNTRSELALQDLFRFALYIISAFLGLSKAIFSTLLNVQATQEGQQPKGNRPP